MSKILLIEDNSLTAKLLESAVTKFGHTVVGNFESYKDVYELIGYMNVDLIISDIKLVDGDNGLHEAVQLREVYAIPILFYSGSFDEHQVTKTLDKLQNVSFVSKTDSIEKLKHAITSLLSNQVNLVKQAV